MDADDEIVRLRATQFRPRMLQEQNLAHRGQGLARNTSSPPRDAFANGIGGGGMVRTSRSSDFLSDPSWDSRASKTSRVVPTTRAAGPDCRNGQCVKAQGGWVRRCVAQVRTGFLIQATGEKKWRTLFETNLHGRDGAAEEAGCAKRGHLGTLFLGFSLWWRTSKTEPWEKMRGSKSDDEKGMDGTNAEKEGGA